MSSKHNKIYIREQIYKNLILSTSKHTPPYFLSLNLEGKLVPVTSHRSVFLRLILHFTTPHFCACHSFWLGGLGNMAVHLLGNCHSCSNHLFLPIIAEQQDTYSRIICYLLVSVHHPSSFLLVSNGSPGECTHVLLRHLELCALCGLGKAAANSFQLFLPCSADREIREASW